MPGAGELWKSLPEVSQCSPTSHQHLSLWQEAPLCMTGPAKGFPPLVMTFQPLLLNCCPHGGKSEGMGCAGCGACGWRPGKHQQINPLVMGGQVYGLPRTTVTFP